MVRPARAASRRDPLAAFEARRKRTPIRPREESPVEPARAAEGPDRLALTIRSSTSVRTLQVTIQNWRVATSTRGIPAAQIAAGAGGTG